MPPKSPFLKWLLAPFLALLCLGRLGAQDRPPVRELLRRMDGLYRGQTSRGEIEMTVKTPDWKRTLDLKVWSEGMDKTFVVIRSPRKDAGIATLRVGRDMWNFFPRINKVLQVPPSMMMGSWMGSDFTNDDLVKESSLAGDYQARYDDREGPPGTWTLELTPKAQTATVWARILLSVRPGDLLPVEEAYFDGRGRKVRVMKFGSIRRVGNRLIPMEMELDPLTKPGDSTELLYRSLEFDLPLDPLVFSLQNLRRER
jgi:Outer membrane lipoprotein-sorting protein